MTWGSAIEPVSHVSYQPTDAVPQSPPPRASRVPSSSPSPLLGTARGTILPPVLPPVPEVPTDALEASLMHHWPRTAEAPADAPEASLLMQRLRTAEAALDDERILSSRERAMLMERLAFAEAQDEAARERLMHALTTLRARHTELHSEAWRAEDEYARRFSNEAEELWFKVRQYEEQTLASRDEAREATAEQQRLARMLSNREAEQMDTSTQRSRLEAMLQNQSLALEDQRHSSRSELELAGVEQQKLEKEVQHLRDQLDGLRADATRCHHALDEERRNKVGFCWNVELAAQKEQQEMESVLRERTETWRVHAEHEAREKENMVSKCMEDLRENGIRMGLLSDELATCRSKELAEASAVQRLEGEMHLQAKQAAQDETTAVRLVKCAEQERCMKACADLKHELRVELGSETRSLLEEAEAVTALRTERVEHHRQEALRDELLSSTQGHRSLISLHGEMVSELRQYMEAKASIAEHAERRERELLVELHRATNSCEELEAATAGRTAALREAAVRERALGEERCEQLRREFGSELHEQRIRLFHQTSSSHEESHHWSSEHRELSAEVKRLRSELLSNKREGELMLQTLESQRDWSRNGLRTALRADLQDIASSCLREVDEAAQRRDDVLRTELLLTGHSTQAALEKQVQHLEREANDLRIKLRAEMRQCTDYECRWQNAVSDVSASRQLAQQLQSELNRTHSDFTRLAQQDEQHNREKELRRQISMLNDELELAKNELRIMKANAHPQRIAESHRWADPSHDFGRPAGAQHDYSKQVIEKLKAELEAARRRQDMLKSELTTSETNRKECLKSMDALMKDTRKLAQSVDEQQNLATELNKMISEHEQSLDKSKAAKPLMWSSSEDSALHVSPVPCHDSSMRHSPMEPLSLLGDLEKAAHLQSSPPGSRPRAARSPARSPLRGTTTSPSLLSKHQSRELSPPVKYHEDSTRTKALSPALHSSSLSTSIAGSADLQDFVRSASKDMVSTPLSSREPIAMGSKDLGTTLQSTTDFGLVGSRDLLHSSRDPSYSSRSKDLGSTVHSMKEPAVQVVCRHCSNTGIDIRGKPCSCAIGIKMSCKRCNGTCTDWSGKLCTCSNGFEAKGPLSSGSTLHSPARTSHSLPPAKGLDSARGTWSPRWHPSVTHDVQGVLLSGLQTSVWSDGTRRMPWEEPGSSPRFGRLTPCPRDAHYGQKNYS